MRKNVWLWNHYATNMAVNQGGRHYWFAENLKKQGYEPVIFCANTFHSDREPIDLGRKKYKVEIVDGIPFVYVKTKAYVGNGVSRVRNMFLFYKNIFSVAKSYAKKHGGPDVIIASSVHPLTMVAGIQIAEKFGVPCICEVRDLWPESLVAYDIIGRNSLITRLLYKGEKWIYKKADAVVMTWEGGKDYIVERGWDKEIPIEKIRYIPNGVVLDAFDKNCIDYPINDSDLDDKDYCNVVYTGSIRKVNNLGVLLDAAKIIWEQGHTKIRFLIYGSGNETEMLIRRCEEEKIDNVKFKGRVDKKFVPSILTQANVNVLHNSSTSLDKYGQSQNKLFEYLAAGKCIVQTYSTGYSVCDRYECGISASEQTAEKIAQVVIEACTNREKSQAMGINARKASYDFDFAKLTEQLIDVIESV